MYTRAIRSSSTAVSIGRKPGIGPRSSPLLSPNRGGRVGSLRLSASLMQALHTPILSPSVARPIWNHRSLQRLHISIHSACSILLNFLIHSQLAVETGSGVAVIKACHKGACHEGACYKGAYCKGAYRKGACYKEGSISNRVGIRGRVGISSKAGIE